MEYRERARSLRQRLNDQTADIEILTAEAADLFHDSGLVALARWTKLDINGYGSGTDVRQLHELLAVAPDDRLISHVAAYRVQSGWTLDEQGNRGERFNHFFVENLRDLTTARSRVHDSGIRSSLLLDFGPHEGLSSYPRSAEFKPDVFDRILLGFRAVLHLQLGRIAE